MKQPAMPIPIAPASETTASAISVAIRELGLQWAAVELIEACAR